MRFFHGGVEVCVFSPRETSASCLSRERCAFGSLGGAWTSRMEIFLHRKGTLVRQERVIGAKRFAGRPLLQTLLGFVAGKRPSGSFFVFLLVSTLFFAVSLSASIAAAASCTEASLYLWKVSFLGTPVCASPVVVKGRIAEQRLFACKPKFKKLKALRNYKKSCQREQERGRLDQEKKLRQQLAVAVAQLEAGILDSKENKKVPVTDETQGSFTTIHGVKIPLSREDALKSAELRLSPRAAETHQISRVSYKFVGGTWRRAVGRERFVTIPNAAFVEACFSTLSDERKDASPDSAEALYERTLKRARKLDAGIFDLKEYAEEFESEEEDGTAKKNK